jgi:copper chaperone CopZ
MGTTVQLRVTGMTCGGCENAVKRALLRSPGVEEATASHQQTRVDIRFDPAVVTLDALKAQIAQLGYTVEA